MGQKAPFRCFHESKEYPLQTLSPSSVSARAPLWFIASALGGIAWNLFGAVQFAGTLTATPESLVAAGMTPEQAAVMGSYPAWMTLAFGVGVAGGLAGSLLLLLRHRLARAVLATSLIAYVALWTGDAAYGVFAALGTPQVVILTLVVAIAAALLAISLRPVSRA
jgi:hypothetical protein